MLKNALRSPKFLEALKRGMKNTPTKKSSPGAVSEAVKRVAAGKAEAAPATEYVRVGRFGRIPKSFLTPKPKQTTLGAMGSAMTGKSSAAKEKEDEIRGKAKGFLKSFAKRPRFAEGGEVYEVNGQRVTKKQYEEAAKKMDKPKSKAEEELFDFANKAKARNKMTPINKAKGGEAKKPPGLYANIHAKRKRIAAGSGEKMRKVGSKGAPTKAAFIKSAKTAKKG